jgi:glycosyltransferase involved in cell wall biosynthesis
MFKIDLEALYIKKQFFHYAELLKGYDVVQFINESAFNTGSRTEILFINFLKKYNEKLFLLSCGTDYTSVKFAFEKHFNYSILTPLFKGKVSASDCEPALKYLRPNFKQLHDVMFSKINGVIASDLDYHIPLKGHPAYLGLIPNPVNIDILDYSPLKIAGEIVIFHGINSANYHKKGADLFEEALHSIKSKFGKKIRIKTVRSLPYNEYIQEYNAAHIILDQVYAYDQGYNALEAMAKGKVVLTGAEKEFETFYNLQEPVAINVLPDVNNIVMHLERLIENPELILSIGANARSFIQKEHHYINVAKQYIATWTAN